MTTWMATTAERDLDYRCDFCGEKADALHFVPWIGPEGTRTATREVLFSCPEHDAGGYWVALSRWFDPRERFDEHVERKAGGLEALALYSERVYRMRLLTEDNSMAVPGIYDYWCSACVEDGFAYIRHIDEMVTHAPVHERKVTLTCFEKTDDETQRRLLSMPRLREHPGDKAQTPTYPMPDPFFKKRPTITWEPPALDPAAAQRANEWIDEQLAAMEPA